MIKIGSPYLNDIALLWVIANNAMGAVARQIVHLLGAPEAESLAHPILQVTSGRKYDILQQNALVKYMNL